MENLSRYGPLTQQVATNAQKIRKTRRLTLAQVAERMSDLGRPMTLNGVSKIERGNRGVDLDDVVALARALDVPPLVLVLPIGSEPAVELLPGYEVRPWTAARWFTGEQPLPPEAPGKAWTDLQAWEHSPAALFRTHDELVRRWFRIERSIEWRGKTTAADLEQQEDVLIDIQRHRQEMRRLGVNPDPLPVIIPIDSDNDSILNEDPEGDRGER
jgi:transcriptional regulator with XRE-family HTH domain